MPCALTAVPTWWVEDHPVPCLYRLAFKRRCLGCGMARALSSAAHGDFSRSVAYNKLVVIVLPLAIFAWLRAVSATYHDFRAV